MRMVVRWNICVRHKGNVDRELMPKRLGELRMKSSFTLKRNMSHWEKKAGCIFYVEKTSMTKVC